MKNRLVAFPNEASERGGYAAEGDAVSNSGGVHHASHSNLQLSPDQLRASTSTAHLASTAALPSSAHSQRSSVLPVGDDSWSHEAISRKDSAQLPAPGDTSQLRVVLLCCAP